MSLWHLGPSATDTDASDSDTGGPGLKYAASVTTITLLAPTTNATALAPDSTATGSAVGAIGSSQTSAAVSTLQALQASTYQDSASQATTSQASASATASFVPASAPSAAASGTSYQPQMNAPSSGASKYVWAHLIVGNTYPYTYDDWVNDISLASANGIDGFVLNVGSDSWQPGRVADAYSAAQNNGFKMMLSFDMTALGCWSSGDASLIQTYAKNYINHPAAAQINGKSAVTTFSGQECTFGQSDANAGWAYALGGMLSQIYFMPSYNNDPTALAGSNINAEVNWGSAWPSAGSDIDTSRDEYFMGLLSPVSKSYVGTVSPLFFSHLSYKNFMWRGDDWLFAQRWEQLISMRNTIDQVEVISWNDFGESHYIGPIAGGLPDGTSSYVNEAFEHTDILSLLNFYSTAFKTGSYPAINNDQVWVMARPHPALASAPDPLGPPDGHTFSQDNFYAQVHLTAQADVTLCAGTACSTQSGQPGINRFSLPLVPGQGISVEVQRGGSTSTSIQPDFVFNGSPSTYDYSEYPDVVS